MAAADVSVELRGTGNCSRQVHNFGTAGVFEADSLIACEVITPGGNWSSYPAHKHDEETPVESALEEIYYFEIASGPDGSRGFGYHRVYGTPSRPIEVLEEVRTGDVVLVPHGYHGPSVAAPGYHMYYLNVMAGPGEERAWKIVDDPEHAWLRGTWEDQDVDPRLPLRFTRSVTVVSKASAFKSPHTEPTVRLTVAQATIRFLANQYVERDGERTKFFAGCFGIFGHGNVAGIGQALLQAEVEAAESGTEPALRYVLGRNEQAMVHTAAAYARQKDRLQAWAVTASIGPGSTNMLTGAALATINRLPVLLLPSDTFATRVSAPVLQELELPHDNEMTVNDAFKPLSRFFDRVWRPEQLPVGAARRDAGAHRPGRDRRGHHRDAAGRAGRGVRLAGIAVRRTDLAHRPPAAGALGDRQGRRGHPVGAAPTDRRRRRRHLLRRQRRAGGVRRADRHPGVGDAGRQGLTALRPPAVGRCDRLDRHDRRQRAGGRGRRRDRNRHPLQRLHQRVAHRVQQPRRAVRQHQRRVVRRRQAGRPVASSPMPARRSRRCPTRWATTRSATNTARTQPNSPQEWDDTVSAAYRVEDDGSALNQSQVIGLANTLSDPRDVVVCAAGSMPGDLHKLWRTRDRKGYHVEYGYSCMGYEVAGGIGVRMASPDRDVFVMVGDGSYLMMATELVTAVQEGVKVIVVLVQNHGFASIGSLSESLGSQRFGTSYRYRSDDGPAGRRDKLPVDLAANAASLGAEVIR